MDRVALDPRFRSPRDHRRDRPFHPVRSLCSGACTRANTCADTLSCACSYFHVDPFTHTLTPTDRDALFDSYLHANAHACSNPYSRAVLRRRLCTRPGASDGHSNPNALPDT